MVDNRWRFVGHDLDFVFALLATCWTCQKSTSCSDKNVPLNEKSSLAGVKTCKTVFFFSFLTERQA